jgi:hypothetical protein
MKTLMKIGALVLIILLPTVCQAGSKLSPDEAKKLILDRLYKGSDTVWITVNPKQSPGSRTTIEFLAKDDLISPSPQIVKVSWSTNKYFYNITQKGKKFIRNYQTETINGKTYRAEDVITYTQMPGDKVAYLEMFDCKCKINIIINEILHRGGIAKCTYTITISDDNPVLANFPNISRFITTGTSYQTFVKYDEGWRMQ